MGKSDVEMEDIVKHTHDSGNIVQESEDKLHDGKVQIKEENFSPATAVAKDANKSEDGGEDPQKLRNELKDKNSVKNEMEGQINPKDEANEPINAEGGSVEEQINTESENEELINTNTKAEAQTGSRSTVEEQTDAINEVVEQKPSNGGLKEEKSTEDGGEDPQKLRNESKNKNSVKNEMADQINPKDEANEPINAEGGSVEEQINTESENEELINTETKAEEQTAARSAAEEQTDAINEVVEQNPSNGGLKEEKSTENGMDSGSPVNYVMEEKPSENIAEKKPKEIGREDADPAGYVAVEEYTTKIADDGNHSSKIRQLPNANETPLIQKATLDEVPQDEDEEMEDVANVYEAKEVKDQLEQSKEIAVTDDNANSVETASKHADDEASFQNQQEPVTPSSLVKFSPAKAGDHTGETVKTIYTQATLPLMAESDDGTPEEQAAFMKEVESFYRERAMDFKPPKFYGQPLNCLKLWSAVIRLGGYDRVTGAKLWRQVGESFHPPKTCTTVSWTFRIFYEKSLLEYERHKTQSGELQLPVATLPEASGVDGEGNGFQGSGSGSGRARRDAASRAMQGRHAQHLFGYGEVGEPIIKDKNLNNMAKREKNLKSIGTLKQKRPNDVEHSIKAARTETSKQLVTSVVDIGPPADWVKINVRQTKDCFEVYALVPGLLREEVRVQSDPAGRLVVTGQPEQVDNPWGITPFKKVVSLPGRIDPLQTSAVVSLHGRLFVRVPFEQSNI